MFDLAKFCRNVYRNIYINEVYRNWTLLFLRKYDILKVENKTKWSVLYEKESNSMFFGNDSYVVRHCFARSCASSSIFLPMDL